MLARPSAQYAHGKARGGRDRGLGARPHRIREELFCQQAEKRDRRKREALLHQISSTRVMRGPILEPATLHDVRPRVEEPVVGLKPLLYLLRRAAKERESSHGRFAARCAGSSPANGRSPVTARRSGTSCSIPRGFSGG
jgi:hypothetical protein